MRNRSVGINVRVNEKEKKKLQKNAKKSGLTLSAYLRKTGLGQKIYEIPDENFYKVYTGIVELKNEFSAKYDEEEIEEKITKIQSDFLDIYNHKDSGDDENGDNKNMGN
jgi:hypothetical protein